jgi:hypothetical protein
VIWESRAREKSAKVVLVTDTSFPPRNKWNHTFAGGYGGTEADLPERSHFPDKSLPALILCWLGCPAFVEKLVTFNGESFDLP